MSRMYERQNFYYALWGLLIFRETTGVHRQLPTTERRAERERSFTQMGFFFGVVHDGKRRVRFFSPSPEKCSFSLSEVEGIQGDANIKRLRQVTTSFGGGLLWPMGTSGGAFFPFSTSGPLFWGPPSLQGTRSNPSTFFWLDITFKTSSPSDDVISITRWEPAVKTRHIWTWFQWVESASIYEALDHVLVQKNTNRKYFFDCTSERTKEIWVEKFLSKISSITK